MDFCILGSLEARDQGGPIRLGGAKPRALLAMLLLHANETLSIDTLMDGLWGEHPPATGAKAVRVHIAGLRKALGDRRGTVVVTRDHGYELRLDPEHLDAHRFERLVAEGRDELAAGHMERAAAALQGAFGLWRGAPLSDLAYTPFAQREVARLEDLRVRAREDLMEAKLALGAHGELVGELEALIAENPHRERLWAQLMLALYRCERQADALEAYQDARRTLRDELGIEPGERLHGLEQAILAHDPALAPPAVEPPPARETTEHVGAREARGPVIGRESELAAVEATLVAASDGLRLLVLEGEPGIGKTTVWREGIVRAADRRCRVLSCRPAPAETRLSFAGLGDLLATVEPEAFAPLPSPQRRGLEVALLRAEAEELGLDPRAIGMGLVSLVSGLAAEGPVLLAIDDVQWLDRPTVRALEFALRRIESAPVAVLATVRPKEPGDSAGLLSAPPPERARRVRVGPLSREALHGILTERLGDALTRPLLTSIDRASRGNPFYALELARAVESAGPPASGETLPVPDDVRDLVRSRLRALPPPTREELLKASALAQPTTGLVDADDLAPAIDAGVVSVDAEGRVEFSHPLFASAIHAAASPERRRRLHADLAQVVSGVEARAWHLSLATDGPDESVAAVLDEAADEAHRRGAPEVAAEFEERAAKITPERAGQAKWERALRAGRHHLKAGDPELARTLAAEVAAASPPPRVRSRALHLQGEACTGGRPGASIPFLEEALTYAADDAQHAAEIELGLGLGYMGIADPVQAKLHLDGAVQLAGSAGESGLLAEATAFREAAKLFSGQGVDYVAIERALALEDPARDVPFQLRPSMMVASLYLFTGRIDLAEGLLARTRERIVACGEEADLAFVLPYLATTTLLSGKFDAAAATAEEAIRAAALAGQEIFSAWGLALRAMARASTGAADEARRNGQEALALSERIGWPDGIGQSRWALGFLALSEGDPHGAMAALEPVVATVEGLAIYEWPLACSVPDAIEALIATARLDRAARLADALADWGRRFDRPWALAVSARSHALLHAAAGELDRAEAAAERAVVEHERLPFPFERARTLLALGQIRRRSGRRRAARESLEQALTAFEELDARLWAEKARNEVERIGVRHAPADLTENELRVAELAADGLTNREIAAQMFMGRRTVEANLARAYRKLGIHSRAELGATMAKRAGARS